MAGLDIGSATASAVILVKDEITAVCTRLGSEGSGYIARQVIELARERAGIKESQPLTVVATGSGKGEVDFAARKVSEVLCLARGARRLFPQARTVIDAGAENCRVIWLGTKGQVEEFVTNDKCAGGTGMFLEVMEHILQIPVINFAAYAFKASTKVEVTSKCAVFAESQVISYIHSNVPVENIVAGICDAVAARLVEVAGPNKLFPEVILTGGVLRNDAIYQYFRERTGMDVKRPANPQMVGALGAALIARELEGLR